MRRGLFAVGARQTALDYEQRIGAIAIEQPHRHIGLVLDLRISAQIRTLELATFEADLHVEHVRHDMHAAGGRRCERGQLLRRARGRCGGDRRAARRYLSRLGAGGA